MKISALTPGAFEFACHSSACRPPTSGGTGGSSSGGKKGVTDKVHSSYETNRKYNEIVASRKKRTEPYEAGLDGKVRNPDPKSKLSAQDRLEMIYGKGNIPKVKPKSAFKPKKKAYNPRTGENPPPPYFGD